MWLQVAILVASYLLSAANQPKPAKPKPAAFSSFDFPRCEEGSEKTVLFGQRWTKSWMVLSVRNQRSEAIKSSGGKK